MRLSNERKSYAKFKEWIDMPDLLDVQKISYAEFLQKDVAPEKRKNIGLQKVFNTVFPVADLKGRYELELKEYSIGAVKYNELECQERGASYSAPLKAVLSLSFFDVEKDERKFRERITNEVFLGEIPLMTGRGTFIINGAERVIVSQLHRSPGVFFDSEDIPGGKVYKSRIIPFKGSWLEFLIDKNDVLVLSIDRKRKMPASLLLRALGYSENRDIINLFYETEEIDISKKKKEDVLMLPLAKEVVDMETGEVLFEVNTPINESVMKKLKDADINKVEVVKDFEKNQVVHNTMLKDNTKNEADGLMRIYALMRANDAPNVESARQYFNRLFFDDKRYDLGNVGRYRLNKKLDLDIDPEQQTLTNEDIIGVIKYMLKMRNGEGELDDIDHLGNRRARSVGELLTNQFSIAFARMQKNIKERLSLRDSGDLTPKDVVNARTVATVIGSFFGSSQLSQFMDQTNPLAELTHKRRVSALGPGGLSRERAGFEVRDVHYSHYGRLCPIETPEGPNIGLIASLSLFARINDYGFIESPFAVVKNGKLTGEVEFLTAEQGDHYFIAPGSTPVDDKGRLLGENLIVRKAGEFPIVPVSEINYLDVSKRQMLSLATSLIPFLSHDDANRALMGSNMQRQAVPLLRPESPIVGTGLEAKAAYDSGAMIIAKNAGTVAKVDARRIVVKRSSQKEEDLSESFMGMPQHDVYDLIKFKRTNQNTSINQVPLVREGQRVRAGDVLADGAATDNGELALGKNALVAFMPWRGFNFEDAIIISEKLLAEDTYTSIHVEEFDVEVRDTKRGVEEITREIPNVSEDIIRNLDENGIIRVGAWVEPGDFLVGKVTPKGETELSPEERLLRAIFGEKAGDVRDSSLKAPPGLEGVVIDSKVFSRKERDRKTKKRDKEVVAGLESEAADRIKEIKKTRDTMLADTLQGEVSGELIDFETNTVLVKKGTKFTKSLIGKTDFTNCVFNEFLCEDQRKNKKAINVLQSSNEMIKRIQDRLEKEIDKIIRGDELKPGVVQLVKVYIAKKRKISVGDKMAGRHGNKGVISKILPVEDMPYLEDGTPVDIILNPLGVPSRMNVGQILETHLGWAASKLGFKAATPGFGGATYEEVIDSLKEAGLPDDGKAKLRDGRTGEFINQPVTVGYIYMLKLSHLVDDKIHARSIGPYSLVTQQPLGGKSQFGGQRFGEMEVWALEAYGAAYTLQEMLTAKSDDVLGRTRIYESIVKGENPPKPGIPESFNVLIREMRSLCLDVGLDNTGI